MVHSQSGSFGFKVAEARPDKVKALVASSRRRRGDKNKVGTAQDTPIFISTATNARTTALVENPPDRLDYAGVLKGAGGSVDIVRFAIVCPSSMWITLLMPDVRRRRCRRCRRRLWNAQRSRRRFWRIFDQRGWSLHCRRT